MFSLPAQGSKLIQQFRALFTKRSFALLKQLLADALLSVGARTICAAQRQLSDKAIARSTPCLMELFSITALWADKLQGTEEIAVKQTSWYQKKLPTFSDALAAVRRQLWDSHHYCTSGSKGADNRNIHPLA